MENYSIVDNNLYQNYDYLNEVINHTLEVMDAKESIFTIIFVTKEETSTEFPIIGYKHHSKSSITWTKNRTGSAK